MDSCNLSKGRIIQKEKQMFFYCWKKERKAKEGM